MRATIANLMARSKREIPHYYLRRPSTWSRRSRGCTSATSSSASATRLVPAALHAQGHAPSPWPRRPELNGFWIDGHFRPADTVHLGVAVSLRGGGLVAPAIHDAPSLSLTELMGAMKDLSSAREPAGSAAGS